jgi:type I restriction enzyme M protein
LENNFSLIPSKYISFIDKDDQLNFDVEMKKIQSEFKKIIKEEKKSQEELAKAFNDLGYEL